MLDLLLYKRILGYITKEENIGDISDETLSKLTSNLNKVGHRLDSDTIRAAELDALDKAIGELGIINTYIKINLLSDILIKKRMTNGDSDLNVTFLSIVCRSIKKDTIERFKTYIYPKLLYGLEYFLDGTLDEEKLIRLFATNAKEISKPLEEGSAFDQPSLFEDSTPDKEKYINAVSKKIDLEKKVQRLMRMLASPKEILEYRTFLVNSLKNLDTVYSTTAAQLIAPLGILSSFPRHSRKTHNDYNQMTIKPITQKQEKTG